jgi:hypothetical protein
MMMPFPASRYAHWRWFDASHLCTLLVAISALLIVDRCQADWVDKVRKAQATYYPAIDACVQNCVQHDHGVFHCFMLRMPSRGSCGYGLTDLLPTGRFIAAVSDKVLGYQDMCGYVR